MTLGLLGADFFLLKPFTATTSVGHREIVDCEKPYKSTMADNSQLDDDEEVNEELLAYMSQAFNVSREISARNNTGGDDSFDDESSVGSRSSRSSFYSQTTINASDDGASTGDDESRLFEGNQALKKSKIYIFLCIVMMAIAGHSFLPSSSRSKRMMYLRCIRKVLHRILLFEQRVTWI